MNTINATITEDQGKEFSRLARFIAPEEAHFSVGKLRNESHAPQQQVIPSKLLADRVATADHVWVDRSRNPSFRLPKDSEAPVIMVGSGRGLAPFRALMDEREATAAKGWNWLICGDRNFHSDFLCRKAWLEYRKNGLLTKIDVALSRDFDEKTYLQNRMKESSGQLYAWLETGAYLYVSGGTRRMSLNVHVALIDVVSKASRRGREWACEYVRELQAEKRYQRDDDQQFSI